MEILSASMNDNRLLELIGTHKQFCEENTPIGSGHAVTTNEIEVNKIQYWLSIIDDVALGCVGLQAIDENHAEIKTLHVLQSVRGKGIGTALMERLLKFAVEHNYKRISLETGKSDGFEPSRRLYQSMGFSQCEAFGAYVNDPFSFCMTKEI